MGSFSEQKSVEIEKLKKANGFLSKLLNAEVQVLENGEDVKLQDILQKNSSFLRKLERDEFEIAIVGLEKAGKSTFANALIESDVLPSAPERCTFTSTRLVYGSEDRAKVEFYTTEEFNKIFKSMLKDLEYEDADNTSFRTLTTYQFENFFQKLEEEKPNLYKAHVGKTDEEIKDILKVRDRLQLDRPIREFFGSEGIESEEFKAYIKGENKGQDTSKPRSVKKIEIESSKLNRLKTAIIYDVPGFDSPTKIHERQTIERLKSADAIILVTNAGRNPSLVGTQLNIITKHSDYDGIPLNEKLFVFGNQIDLVNSEGDIERNKNTLSNDVLKYRIGKRERVFVGSAQKYLVDQKIRDDNYNTKFEFSDGIEEIRSAITEFYENERFSMLQRKIDKNIENLKEIVESVKSRFNDDFDQRSKENEKNRLIRNASRQIESSLEDGLKTLKYRLKQEIWDEGYFTKKFIEEVDKGNYFKDIDQEFVESVKIDTDDSVTMDTPIERINHKIREELQIDFLKEFTKLIIEMTDEKSSEVKKRILTTFAKSIGINTDSSTMNKIEEFIEDTTKEVAHNGDRFSYLIERFSRNIFDVLIARPILSEDRKNKFEAAEIEFKYLDLYYGGDGRLVSMVLNGKDEPVQIGSSATTQKSGHQSVRYRQQTQASKNNSSYIENIWKNAKTATSESELIAEINNDIKNLREILKKAVVKAINLELAFLNGVDKQIKLLVDSFTDREDENAKRFDEFISDVLYEIKQDEIEAINQKIEAIRLKREFVESLKDLEF